MYLFEPCVTSESYPEKVVKFAVCGREEAHEANEDEHSSTEARRTREDSVSEHCSRDEFLGHDAPEQHRR